MKEHFRKVFNRIFLTVIIILFQKIGRAHV